MLGGKPVVLEYDTQARDNKPSPGAPANEQKAISKARVSYAAGNQKLFAGDATSAILYYKQSLAAYPGYVAGYRGLGLAYAKLNDKAKAVQALKTYLGAAPGAKDAPLLKKRIASLK
jgi:regulator of sirC expression with transglutaminase-like and TPR domain